MIRTPLASPSPTMAMRDMTHVSPEASTLGMPKCDLLHDPGLAASLWNSEDGLGQVLVAQEQRLSWSENLPIFTFEQVYDSEGMLT